MTALSKVLLSGSTSGKGIKVVPTSTIGTTIHTAHATALDEMWVYAYNGHTADVVLTLENGGATVPDQNIVVTVPFKDGLYLVVPGLLLTGGLLLTAFAATANVIVLSGYVNRLT